MKKYGLMVMALAGMLALACTNNDPLEQEMEEIEETVGGNLSDVLDLPTTHFNYSNPDLPQHFRQGNTAGIDNTPVSNPVTE